MSRERALRELEEAWRSCRADPGFVRELRRLFTTHAGRPTPLTRLDRLAERLGSGIRLYLKREDLAHTGTHEINGCLGQALLAKRLGKSRLVAGIGTGRQGVAAASAAAALGLRCVIYLPNERARREALGLSRMRLLGAEVVPVTAGAGSSEDADREAGRDWAASFHDTGYLPGVLVTDPPYPSILRDLQSVIGHEARSQMLEAEGRMPDSIVAWAGGTGGSIGLLQAFLDDRQVRMFRVGAAGAEPGSPYGAAGPPGAGSAPGRIVEAQVDEKEALEAFRLLAETEGILPSLESARALAFVARQAPAGEIGRTILVGLSGRAEEDLPSAPGGDLGAAPERRRA